jgi:hypothetical protein
MPEPSRLKQRRGDHVAERQKRERGRHNEERDLTQARIQPRANGVGAEAIRGALSGHGRQFGGRDRHAEQTDGQRVQQLSVCEAGDRPGRQQARQQRVYVRAHLHDAAADEHRSEVANDLADLLRHQIECGARVRRDPDDGRQLYRKLERAAGDRSPREQNREARERRVGAKRHERRDHRSVPHDRSGVRQQEAAVSVEDPETPG